MEEIIKTNNEQKEKKEKLLSPTFIIFIALIFIISRLFQIALVSGNSMYPNLHNGDNVLVERDCLVKQYNRFDVVILDSQINGKYIKRVIGLPGETVQIKDGNIYINGQLLTENYGNERYIYNSGIAGNEIILADDEYFVLGDNRNHSCDSREIGPINKKQMIGKIIWQPKHK